MPQTSMLFATGAPAIAGVTEQFAVVDGYQMRYLTAGSGPALLMIPAIVSYSFSWRFNLLPLSQHYTVFAPDMLNLGFSERVPGLSTDLASTSDRLLRFMDWIGVARPHIVASSHGGAVAIALAARSPDRVQHMVLNAPANPWSSRTNLFIRFYRGTAGRQFARFAPFGPALLRELAFRRLYGDPKRVRPGTEESYCRSWRIVGTMDHALAIVRGWQADMNLLENSLERVTAPVLLLWGDRDRVVDPASAHALRQRLRNASLTIIDGAGHLPYEEVPEEFNRIVREYLDYTAFTEAVDQASI